jgi:superfamily II DNA or RNA helicase
MKLRPYQVAAVQAVHNEWDCVGSTLLVLATGLGKTVVFSHVAHERSGGRVMVVAHREELIWQAAAKLKAITGEVAEIEMADQWAATDSLVGESKVIVSSVQTLNSGMQGKGRVTRFNPNDFSTLIIDEAHHATSPSYQYVINWFRQNPDLRVLGVTATPDRADQVGLGHIFESVAYEFDIAAGISEGWLCPIDQRIVHVHGLDFANMRTTAGDLNGADLARVMEYEENLHRIASPVLDLSRGRKTLVFASSVKHAERLSEIFNRHHDGCSRWVCGKTPKETRQGHLQDFSAGKFQIMCNVGVFTEGFDEPGIEVIAMARPTKSRALYVQMAGRGTRPLPGVVDGQEHACDRLEAIACSAKPCVEVIDFVGNAGRHKLITTIDILAGNEPPEVIERARENIKKADGPVNIKQELTKAAAELMEERKRVMKEDEAKRATVKVKAQYSTSSLNPFDLLDIAPPRAVANVKAPPTDRQVEWLQQQGVDTAGMSQEEAGVLVGELKRRYGNNQCSFKQAKILAKRGLSTEVTRTEAKAMIDEIAQKEGWGQPKGQRTTAPVAPAAVPSNFANMEVF